MDIARTLYGNTAGFREESQVGFFEFRVIKLACSFNKMAKTGISFLALGRQGRSLLEPDIEVLDIRHQSAYGAL